MKTINIPKLARKLGLFFTTMFLLVVLTNCRHSIGFTNQQPMADAGPNIYLDAPMDQTVLRASAIDQDGEIQSYLWQQLQGEPVAMEGITSQELYVSNLMPGTYRFQVTVEDDQNFTDTDEVTVQVYPHWVHNPVPHMGPFPPEAIEAFYNVEDFGARGDDLEDDTEALQRAINQVQSLSTDLRGHAMKVIYLPAGDYYVSDKLTFGEENVRYMVVLGENKTNTRLILSPHSPGFDQPAQPKEVLAFFDGESDNNQFWNSVINLTIAVEEGNPGAIALQYHQNNAGRIQDVALIAKEGSGKYGLNIDKFAAGIGLIKYVTIEGFEVGINIEQRLMTYTLEHVLVQDQRRVGIAIDQKPTTLRDIISHQSISQVPGLSISNQGTNRKEALGVILDSEFVNNAGGGTAIFNESFLFARNIHTRGYTNSLVSKGEVITDRDIDEYTSDQVYRLWENTPRRSLNLGIKDVPDIPFDPNFDHWAIVDMDTIAPKEQATAVQTAIDDGYSTIYLKCQQARYEPNQTVVIRNNVERIHGGWCNVRPTDNFIQSPNPIWQIETHNSDALIFEAFHTANPPGTEAWWWQNNSTKTVILADVEIPARLHQPYKNSPGAGDLFIEQVFNHTGGGMTYKPDGWWVFDRQNVWARNLDAEFHAPHVTNNGGKLWMLGVKLGEHHGPYLRTYNQGQTEVLGGILNAQNYDVDPSGFDYHVLNDNSAMTLAIAERSHWHGHRKKYQHKVTPYIIREIRKGETRTFSNDDMPNVRFGDGVIVNFYQGGNLD